MRSTWDFKFREFFRGLSIPLRSLEMFFAQPKLLGLTVIPVLITLMLIAGLTYACLAGAWAEGRDLFQNYLGNSTWLVSSLIMLVVASLILYFIFHTFSILLSLVASPFNDLISEATEKARGISLPNLGVRDLIKVFFLDLRKTAVSLVLSIGFGLLSLVPVLGIISLFGFALIHTLTFITYPHSRRKYGLRDSLAWMNQHPEASLGFGLASLILFAIPVMNFFALPISVIGGTLLFLESDKLKANE